MSNYAQASFLDSKPFAAADVTINSKSLSLCIKLLHSLFRSK